MTPQETMERADAILETIELEDAFADDGRCNALRRFCPNKVAWHAQHAGCSWRWRICNEHYQLWQSAYRWASARESEPLVTCSIGCGRRFPASDMVFTPTS